jgi:hypothetical protein
LSPLSFTFLIFLPDNSDQQINKLSLLGSASIQEAFLLIHSHIITYGDAADAAITERIRQEIEEMWNEPQVQMGIEGRLLQVQFRISASFEPALQPIDVIANTDPRNNYFRIEKEAMGNISFVDGIGCNTGFFLYDNLYEGSTTAAHEYGHTLGLRHPTVIDIRGQGVPGIMYPRGSIVDPEFQYNPSADSGDNRNGGTMHPRFRKVKPEDIYALQLEKLEFRNQTAIVGEFSSVWHEKK